jgi:hypothetical protein
VLYAFGFGFGACEVCVEGDIEVTQEDDPSLLEATRGTKSMSSSHSVRTAGEDVPGFMYELIAVVRPRGVRMSKACQRLCWS